MLPSYGVKIYVKGLKIKIKGGQGLKARNIGVPGDFSSAAFFIAAALLTPDSAITIKGVGINPTRTGLLDVLEAMGAEIGLTNIRDVSEEPVADIYVKTASNLKAAKIGRELMPSLIDEFPILCVLGTQADGITEIRGAEELRFKESDRIKAMAEGLKKMGAEVKRIQRRLKHKRQCKP